MDQSNLEGARLVGVEMSRAIARDANLSNVDFTDANAFSTVFDVRNLLLQATITFVSSNVLRMTPMGAEYCRDVP